MGLWLLFFYIPWFNQTRLFVLHISATALYFYLVGGTRVWTEAWFLRGRCSATWAISPSPFLVISQVGFCVFTRASLILLSFYLFLTTRIIGMVCWLRLVFQFFAWAALDLQSPNLFLPSSATAPLLSMFLFFVHKPHFSLKTKPPKTS
jgi:hypothetical protein